MELDNSTILYIVLAIGYFLFNNFIKGKKKQAGPATNGPEDASETLGPPPMQTRPTFEELMEEFTTGKKREIPTFEAIEETPQIVIPEVIVEKSIEEKGQERRAANQEKHFSRFEEFEKEEEVSSSYKELLNQPEGAKKAFVLSEIFNKKF